MNACAAADSGPPSAELLLYLAEFADDEGKPDDPVAVDRELPTTAKKPAATTDDDQPDPKSAPAPR